LSDWRSDDYAILLSGRSFHVRRAPRRTRSEPVVCTGTIAPQRRSGFAPPLPAGTSAKYDVPYVEGGGKSQSLDIFVPAGAAKPMPLVIWIHGGGWQQGDKAQSPAVGLLRWGYVVASINYRLTDEAIFPAQINDCKAAVRWLRAHAEEYHIDPDHIGAWGASAGGHLVALLGPRAIRRISKGPAAMRSSRATCRPSAISSARRTWRASSTTPPPTPPCPSSSAARSASTSMMPSAPARSRT
jgi:acetyl esterase/lipase